MNEAERTENRIGHRLREVARVLFDGNKSELARAIEMKPSSFGKYLRGTRRPGASVLERLTRLGISVDWLLTGEGAILCESASSQQGDLPSRDAPSSQQRQSMSAAELSSLNPQFHPIPVVKPRLENGTFHLDEVGEPEWMSAKTIRNQYGGSPDQLRTFVITSDRMAPTIRPDERARGMLLLSSVPPDGISNGGIYLIHSTDQVLVTRLYRKRKHRTETNDAPSEEEQRDDTATHSAASRNRDEEILLSSDNPEVSDETVSPEEWTADFRVVAQLLEIKRPL
jgi:phage repressor protein C with HTH and peptisase S24 domain